MEKFTSSSSSSLSLSSSLSSCSPEFKTIPSTSTRIPFYMDPSKIVLSMASKPTMDVDNSDPNKSVVFIRPGISFDCQTISSNIPLPRDKCTYWKVTLYAKNGVSFGVNSDPLASTGIACRDKGAIVWDCDSERKHTHGDRGVFTHGLGTIRMGDVAHFKFDPLSLQLQLRLDRKPNIHFDATLLYNTDYYVCLNMIHPGTLVVQGDTEW